MRTVARVVVIKGTIMRTVARVVVIKGTIMRTVNTIDEISIKAPNPKCRLYWCLIEFIDSQSCWYFRPLL
jgi:hypothetical protein